MRKHGLNIFFIILGLCVGLGLYGGNVWQHDILVAPRIPDFYTGIFEFFTGIRTSVGFAYNITLVIQTIGVLIAIFMPLLAVWFWEEGPNEIQVTTATSATSGFTLKRMTPLQGVVAATVILAIIGGVLQELSVWAKTADLAFMGDFQTPMRAFLANSWIVVGITWFYNIFLYLRNTQSQMREELKKYNVSKMVATLTWFTGTLGAVLAFAPTPEIKQWGTFIILIITILMKELQNLFKPTTPTPT